MDVDRVAEELYGLKPDEFVPARDRYVAEARKAKDAPAAKTIAALRRPALAAWAANLLARRQQQEAEEFLTLGETLREAHRTLDGEQLRSASRQQHQLVTALARKAAELSREEGKPVSESVLHEIEQTLNGVLTHPDVAEQWSKGRLVKVPEAAVGFTDILPEPSPAGRRPKRKQQRSAEKKPPSRGKPHPLELETSREAAARAQADVERFEQEQVQAREDHRAAKARAGEAAERLDRLEHEVREARKADREARRSAARAVAAEETGERSLRDARRTADRAVGGLQRQETSEARKQS